MAGVVMSPTYILLGLAITCLLTNVATIILQKRYLYRFSISQNV
jgi:hypothetical protein